MLLPASVVTTEAGDENPIAAPDVVTDPDNYLDRVILAAAIDPQNLLGN